MPATRSVVLVLVVAEQTFTWMMYSPASIANLGGGTSHEGAVRETQGCSTRVKRLNPFTTGTKCEKNGLFVQSDTALLTLVVDCSNSAPPILRGRGDRATPSRSGAYIVCCPGSAAAIEGLEATHRHHAIERGSIHHDGGDALACADCLVAPSGGATDWAIIYTPKGACGRQWRLAPYLDGIRVHDDTASILGDMFPSGEKGGGRGGDRW